jgi:hypothetical protein
MHNLKNITILIAALFITSAAFAQDNNEASHQVEVNWSDLVIMDIENNNGIDLTLETDYGNHEAGAAVGNGTVLASDDNTWLNWTVFAPKQNNQSYNIDVKANTDFNNGWELKVTPTVGTVEVGSANGVGPANLSDQDQTIVNSIPNLSWTGNGDSKGCQIKYEVVVTDEENITATDQTVNVTYTISQQ